jgi:hypothetical protein
MLTATLALTACGLMDRTTLESPAAAQFPGAEDSLDFWDALEKQSVTTNDDALHGLLLLEEAPAGNSWEDRWQAATERGWVPAETAPPTPTESAEMGFIAVCLCHVLDVRGGLSMQLFGRTPRYCTREVVHMGLIPGITEHEALSGAEFIALLGAAEQRLLIDRTWAARAAEVPSLPAEGAAPATTPPADPPRPEQDASQATAQESEPTS